MNQIKSKWLHDDTGILPLSARFFFLHNKMNLVFFSTLLPFFLIVCQVVSWTLYTYESLFVHLGSQPLRTSRQRYNIWFIEHGPKPAPTPKLLFLTLEVLVCLGRGNNINYLDGLVFQDQVKQRNDYSRMVVDILLILIWVRDLRKVGFYDLWPKVSLAILTGDWNSLY